MRYLIFVSLYVVSRPVLAAQPCDEVKKGDISVCLARTKAECNQTDYWPRTYCQQAIVDEVDSCRNGTYSKACEALPNRDSCRLNLAGKTLKVLVGNEFISALNNSDSLMQALNQYNLEWHDCFEVKIDQLAHTCTKPLDECTRAFGQYVEMFKKEVDTCMKGEMPREMFLDNAAILVEANSKLKPKFRYREAELIEQFKLNAQAAAQDQKHAHDKAVAQSAAIRNVYVKAGIQGARLKLFSKGMPEEGYFKAPGCTRFVTTVGELKSSKRLYEWFNSSNGITVKKYTFNGDNYTEDQATFEFQRDAYRFCK